MSDSPTITVFTPSYNRAYILPRLYDSLCYQNNKDFEWIVVDDGSTDNTADLLSQWKKENKIKLRWISQNNQGKHIAINTGVASATGKLFFIVDSDDTLVPEAIQVIITHWKKISYNASISGIISYRKFPNGNIVGNKLPSCVKSCKLRDCIHKYNSVGDKVVVYRVDILKQYPYPKFGNERFLGESYVFNKIDDKYEMSVLDAAIYNFDYQTDGLSQKFRKLYRDNPIGFLACYEQQASLVSSKKQLYKAAAHIVCLSLKTKSFIKTLKKNYNIISLYSIIGGLYLYIKIFIFKSNDVKPYYGAED